MKTQLATVLAVCTWGLSWIGGCSNNQASQRPPTVPEAERPVVTRGDESPAKVSVVTMEYIWKLRETGRCGELVGVVDTYLQTPADENTTATCRYLQGDCLRQLGQFERARKILTDVNDAEEYGGTYWPDPSGEKILVQPLCELGLRLIAEEDACRFPKDSNDYTTLAWKYLNKNKFNTAIFMAWRCITPFKVRATQQQEAHRQEYGDRLPELDKDPTRNKGILERYWALYDVGTCYFILGQAYEYKGDLAAKQKSISDARAFYRSAIEYYDIVIQRFPAAQCFDPRGPWYWQVKEGAEERSDRINAHKLTKS